MANIEKFISFIGPTRTGHSLVASLLGIHPEIDISFKVNPLSKYKEGMKKEELFDSIINSKRRKIGGYEYPSEEKNPKNIKILGDSSTTQKNAIALSNDDTFKGFCNYIGVPIYWIWVIRDPFDNIQSGSLISGNNIDKVTNLYIERMKMTKEFYKKHEDKVFVIHLEDLILDSDNQITEMVEFIGMPINNKYLETCSKFILPKPNKVFVKDDWTQEQIDKVNGLIETLSLI